MVDIISAYVVDNGLSQLQSEADKLYLCSVEPLNFLHTTLTALGNKNWGAGNVLTGPSAGVNGRKVTTVAIVDGAQTAAGTATWWAIVDSANSRLLAKNVLVTPFVMAGSGLFTLNAFDIEIPYGLDDEFYVIRRDGVGVADRTAIRVTDGGEPDIDVLIAGLKTDGVWSKLDRVWVFSRRSGADALIDLVAGAAATKVSSPRFTPFAGYDANGSGYINTGFNPSVGGFNYVQDSAHMSVWDLTSGSTQFQRLLGTNSSGATQHIYTQFSDGSLYARVNSGGVGFAVPDTRGFSMGNRSGASSVEVYKNGSSIGSHGTASTALLNANFTVGFDNVSTNTDQYAAVTLGGSLTGVEALALYNRLRNYMIAGTIRDWVSAVVGYGGSVSNSRKTLITNLINGLVDDGVWYKLDRLWLFAAENQTSALTDLVGRTLGTAVNAPTFTVNRGYTGDGSSSYVTSNYNPITHGVNFTLNSASQGIWLVSVPANIAGNICGGFSASGGDHDTRMSVADDGGGGGSNNFYSSISQSPGGSYTLTREAGLFHASRVGASSMLLYVNGTSKGDSGQTATGLTNTVLYACGGAAGIGLSSIPVQTACYFTGGGMSATDVTNFYNRLRTYMTAVGVP